MAHESAEHSKSIVDRIRHAFHGDDEPRDVDELKTVLREAAGRDIVSDDTMTMLDGVFDVAAMRVRDIMIPRAQMEVVEIDEDLDEFLPNVIESGHSRFPVIGDSRDEVLGVLLAKDLLRFSLPGKKEAFNLKELIREPVFTPESKQLNVLLTEFRANHNHMAIVVDEYGGVAGLVTIEDVLEEIVGEIDDEHDAEEDANIRRHDDYGYTIKALTPIEEFNEELDAELPDDEFDTIGGLVMHQIGRMPIPGEQTQIDRFHIKVISAESRRIHLLQVTTEEEIPG
ncbi:magnesium/cobalt efflux protein [Chromatiales bacterium (ex Bugula neritina AB1)]|nr:magnesium/cobalt efflux protein [Chromatiales bacterium (ex Bugula neritina AB1)]